MLVKGAATMLDSLLVAAVPKKEATIGDVHTAPPRSPLATLGKDTRKYV